MRRSRLLLFLVFLSLTWGMLRIASAQDSPANITFVPKRQFWIPFSSSPGELRIRQVQLYVSTNQGRTWEPFASAPPDQGRFQFIAPADGMYWFAVQTLDQDGKRLPPTMEGASPSLRVVVDTIPPTVRLHPLQPRDGEVGVSWEIRDEYLDLNQANALLLEYRPVGAVGWSPLPRRQPGAQAHWVPEGNSELEVRLRVRDRAGNWGEAMTRVSLGAGTPPMQSEQTLGGPLPDPERRLVNSKTISLGYEIQDKGPSGISALELWYTQDGRGWNKFPLPQPADGKFEPPLVFDVAGEGVYGFTLLAKSGVGLGARPPQIGDRPQVWVEVDLTKPEVKLQQVVVGQEKDKGKLLIAWSARDKNLEKEPIGLSYAEQTKGPWIPVVPNRLANTGQHVWTMPERVPYQFHIKVEALDRAGNLGEAITSEMVKVDLSQPKAMILNVGPGGK